MTPFYGETSIILAEEEPAPVVPYYGQSIPAICAAAVRAAVTECAHREGLGIDEVDPYGILEYAYALEDGSDDYDDYY